MAERTDRPIVPTEHTNEREHRRLLATRANASMPKDGTEGMAAPLRLSSYTVAELPDATLWEGSAVYVSDEGAIAFSDGVSWLRERIVSDYTALYVRGSDGNDANDGSAYTAGGAFKTIRKAVQVAHTFNFGGAQDDALAEIIIEPGTYAEIDRISFSGLISGPNAWLRLRPEGYPDDYSYSAATVTISTTGTAISAAATYIELFGIKVTAGGNGIVSSQGGYIGLVGVNLGACTNAQLQATNQGTIDSYAQLDVSGSAQQMLFGRYNGFLELEDDVVLTGTPNFTETVRADGGGIVQFDGSTLTGAATGKRYRAVSGGIIQTFGAGATYIPGSVAGTLDDAASFYL